MHIHFWAGRVYDSSKTVVSAEGREKSETGLKRSAEGGDAGT